MSKRELRSGDLVISILSGKIFRLSDQYRGLGSFMWLDQNGFYAPEEFFVPVCDTLNILFESKNTGNWGGYNNEDS